MLCAVEGEVVKKDTLITGLALFAMFFGAGNLIFPPYLGMESGTEWVLGFLCFVLIDVVLSCLGIFALNAAGGANAAVEGSIGRVPGLVLNTAVILCTGMVIAEPRTAATTYEMSIVPLFGDGVGILAFSAVFFAVVLALSIRQTHVVTVVGKVLTPLLVACVAVLIVVGVAHPLGDIGAPLSTTVAQDGISAGYQAMDVLACVGFAIVMENAARTAGYTRREDQLKVIAGASVVAGLLLAVIYGGLTFLGAASATSFGAGMDRSTLIVAIVQHLLGDTGMAVLAVIVGLACLTTAIGLTGATASYFERVTHGKVPYRVGVIVCVLVSLALCNLGLNAIIAFAAPILSVVCPPFMVCVVMVLFKKEMGTEWPIKGAAAGAFVISLLTTIDDTFGALPVMQTLPLTEFGFNWLPFAVLGGVVGALAFAALRRKSDKAAA